MSHFRQHERGTFVMLHRRLVRPFIVTGVLAFICYLSLAYHTDLVVLVPKTIALNTIEDPFAGTVSTELRSRIAKVTVAANSLNNSVIHQALQTHQVQNEIHGYRHYITKGELVGDLSENDSQGRPRGAWSKPAYLLSLIVAELTKPEFERLEWLFWFDADTIVLNPHTPLEIFLPPKDVPELSNINLLMASNWDGLNSGAFAFRVHPWSVSILSAVLAYPLYKEDKLKQDRFRDQSAFQWLLQAPESFLLRGGYLGGTDYWADIPMRWFNSLPINNAFSRKWDWIFNHNMTGALFDNGTHEVYPDGNSKKVQPWKVMRGDMVVHFAGTTNVRDSWMKPWLKRAEQYLPEWSNATKQEELKVEARFFWRNITATRISVARKHEKQKAENTVQRPNPFGDTPWPPPKGPKNRVSGKMTDEVPVVDPMLRIQYGAKEDNKDKEKEKEAVKQDDFVLEVVTVTQDVPVGISTRTSESAATSTPTLTQTH